MCNLSEGIWEKGVAAGMAKAIAEGEVNNYTWIFDKLMSKGFEFDEVVDLLDVSPETADKVRGNLTPKTVSRNLSKKIIPIWDSKSVSKRFPVKNSGKMYCL